MIPDAVFLTYNVGNADEGDLVDEIVAWLLRRRVDVAGLCEVGDRARLLDRVAAASGYRLVTVDGVPGAGKLALLLRPGVELERVKGIQLSDRTFVGRLVAGARRTGYTSAKALLAAWVRIDGEPWVVGVTHLTPSAGRVEAAERVHRIQTRAIAAFLLTRFRPTNIMGDVNADKDSRLLELIRRVRLVAIVGAPSFGPRSIDVHILRRAAAEYVEDLPGVSDHDAVIVRARRRRRFRS